MHTNCGGRQRAKFPIIGVRFDRLRAGNCPRGTRMPTLIHISKLRRAIYIVSGGIWLNIDQGRAALSLLQQPPSNGMERFLSLSPQSHIGWQTKEICTRAWCDGVASHIIWRTGRLRAGWENNSCRSLNNIQILFTLPSGRELFMPHSTQRNPTPAASQHAFFPST